MSSMLFVSLNAMCALCYVSSGYTIIPPVYVRVERHNDKVSFGYKHDVEQPKGLDPGHLLRNKLSCLVHKMLFIKIVIN